MLKNDATTNIEELKITLNEFRKNRGWDAFNDPYELAAALSVESTELLEQLLTENCLEKSKADPLFKKKLCDELADVFAFMLTLSSSLKIDLTLALLEKIKK